MKTIYYFFLAVFILLFSFPLFSQSFQFVSPKDNSTLISLSTNLIFTSSEKIDELSLTANDFIVNGSISGIHNGVVKLANNGHTILFIPSSPYSANEDVAVTVKSGIKTIEGNSFSQFSFHFRTTPLSQQININPLTYLGDGSLAKSINLKVLSKSTSPKFTSGSLPLDFPKITVDSSNNPADGKIFLANFSTAANDSTGNYLMILNNDGSVLKYKKLDQPAYDFKVQPNGELSYAEVIVNYTSYAKVRWIVMDTSLTPVDTFQCGNGYTADLHDFLLLPNGHALVLAFDPEPVDLSKVIPGGNPDATVIGAVIQEINASKNVVFQWRTWDYIPITDSYIDLTTNVVDLIHGNAFDVDNDGNILFSMRHLSTIVKIDRQTGNIDWFLGGKQNQFTFLNEHESNSPNYFSFQHDVHILPNGDITMFDNGNQHTPPYSRAVEYKLDEINKTADLVWEYRHTPDIYSFAMGSVQKLSNGNTFIGWGYASANGSPAITELHPDNSTALEISLPMGEASYRAFKFPWASGIPSANVTVYEVYQGNTYKFNSPNDTTGITITFNQLSSALYANAIVTRYDYAPVMPTFNTQAPLLVPEYFNIKGQGITSYNGLVKVNLENYPSVKNPGETIIYARTGSGNNFIPLPTNYDSAGDELTFTTSTFGDFALGIPQTDSTFPPVPFSPKDSEIVDEDEQVNFTWGTRGVVKTYHLQVASDSSFNKIIADFQNLTSTSAALSSVNNNSVYYWRVNSTNSAGISDWSKVFRFSTLSPFIKITTPNGGETVYTDSTFIIRWQTDFDDTVRIKLIDNNNVVAIIGDSIVSATNALTWEISPLLTKDKNYKVEIESLSSPALSSESNSTFTITSGLSAINDSKETISDYSLLQNYPNPFNPSTVIKYSLPEESRVNITIFNLIGQKIATLVNNDEQQGNYEVSWNAGNKSSGIYFYSIRATGSSGKSFYAVKKMILVK